jgi:hypothetical protein
MLRSDKESPFLMQKRSSTGDLLLGLAGLAVTFAGLIAASYGLSSVSPGCGPVIANVLWGAVLLGIAAAGVFARRFGFAFAPLVFVALWAAGAQVHAGIVSAETGTRDGLTSVPDVRPVSTLIVKASYGLPVDPTRTGGQSLLPYDVCGAWCRDLILEKGLGAIVLRTPTLEAPTAETLFRLGTGPECAGNEPQCIVEETIKSYPDGLVIEMGDEEWPDTSSACCPVAVISRFENGSKNVLKTYRQGVNTAILPIPVITATGRPLESIPVMTRNVALGPNLRFDTLLEAMLDTELRWK